MRIKFSIIIVLFLSLFWQQAAWAAVQVEATVSDNTVFLGDRFTLTITINDTDSNYQLDTKPLENDFNVSRPSRSSSSSYVNGKSSYLTTWQVTLQAKRLGDLTIPALKIANLSTNAINITVKKPSKQATKTQDNQLFIENSLDKKNAYICQSIILTSKIYIGRNADDLELIAPSLEGATISIFGEDKKEQTIRNGIRYNIITRQYEINASKAGKFTLQSPVLSGSLRKSVPVDEWRSRIVSEPINIRGDSLTLTIKAIPKDFQGKWLVSEDVRLSEDTKITEQSYHVGEPITRTITLQVASSDTDKLPNIDFNYPKNLRFYPDQDKLTEGQANGLHYAQRVIRHAIIAEKPGSLTLPEIKLAWWNSKTDKQDFAVLPAQTLTILAAETNTQQTIIDKPVTPITPSQSTPSVTNKTLILWQIVCALLLVALIVLTFYHLNYRRSQKTNKNKKSMQAKDQPYEKLQTAFNTQQASLVYQALLHYGQSEFPNLKSLSYFAALTNLDAQDKKHLTDEIITLEKACAKPSSSWDSTALCKLIKRHHQQKNNTVDNNIMDINPS